MEIDPNGVLVDGGGRHQRVQGEALVPGNDELNGENVL
jgi:hypothetical protein